MAPNRMSGNEAGGGRASGEGQPGFRTRLSSGNDAPARARALISQWCESLDLEKERCETLRLLVSEVVTNAVVHPATPRRAVIILEARASGERLRVSVTDSGTGLGPTQRAPDAAAGGFGLFLLERETACWGHSESNGTSVWFELDR